MLVTIKHLPQSALRDISCIYDKDELLNFAKDYNRNNEYIRVADIEFKDDLDNPLDLAFEITNSITEAWYENEDISVSEAAKTGCRSTSKGDIIMIDGRSFIVSTFGFTEL